MTSDSRQHDTDSPLPFSEREILQRKLAVYRYPNLITPEMWQAYQAALARQENSNDDSQNLPLPNLPDIRPVPDRPHGF
ncbi:hypothetical protein DTL42_16105 [Bremerella cremea]|uniref:Uncharacterized protein n=1 Tax=Bremerella cremea TaxID=1031537 RepID=A0A368KRR6_9BACT|nr:hypothetical protein [Bremerella cremea]RCS46479.1 hypothetical protein DTL42_16105 [Bremerella cremea]